MNDSIDYITSFQTRFVLKKNEVYYKLYNGSDVYY